MRRRLTVALGLMLTIATTLLLTSTAAFASEEAGEAAASTDWSGMAGAAVAGLVFGLVIFVDTLMDGGEPEHH